MANSEFIEVASDKAYSEIKRINDEVLAMAKNVKAVNAELGKIGTPSGSSAATAKLVADLKKQEELIKKLQTELTKLAERRRVSSRATAEEAVNQAILNKNAREYATINSTLAGAYARLNAEHAKAARHLQNLVARGRQAGQTQRQYNIEIQKAQREFNTLNTRILAADRAVGKFNRNVGNYPQLVSGFKDLIGAFGIIGGVTAIAALSRDIFNTTRELEGLDLALRQVIGTQEQAAKTQQFLSEIAEDFGVNINVLTRSYTGFYAASKNAIDSGKISAQEIDQIFRSVAKSAGAMGLSVEQQEGAFLALSQMISKGNVQAEEIRGQLAERLPGAFGILAKSMGVTEQQLNKMLKDGEVLAAEVLPAFARELEKAYGVENLQRVETLNASTTRLKNTWIGFIRTLNEGSGTMSKFLRGAVDSIGNIIEGLEFLMTSSEERREQKLAKIRSDAYAERLEMLKGANKAEVEEAKAFSRERANLEIVEIARLRTRNKELSQVPKIRWNSSQAEVRAYNAARQEIQKNNAAILQHNQSLSGYYGWIEAANAKLKELNKTTDDNTEGTKKNTRARAEAIKIQTKELDGMLIRLKKEQEVFKQLQSTSNTRGEFNMWQELIDNYQKAIDVIEKGFGDALQKDADKAIEAMSKMRMGMIGFGESGKLTREELDLLKKSVDGFLDSFSDGFLANAGFKSLEIFTTLDEYGKSTFENLLTQAQETGQGFEVVFNSMTEVAQDAMNFINQAQQAQFEQQYARLEQEKRVALMFAGESATAREEIERQYDERRKAIARSQAEANKRNALFNIVIDTAQAIVAALPNVPLSIAIGLIGAIQAGIVASTPIPQFKDGGVHTAGGLMMVNDGKGSNYRETIVTPDGKIHRPKGRNVIMNAPKGTQIFTHDQWQANLNGILAANDIGHSGVTIVNEGLTADEMRSIMRESLGNGNSIEIIEDYYGSRVYKRNNGRREEQMNARLRLTGRNVGRR